MPPVTAAKPVAAGPAAAPAPPRPFWQVLAERTLIASGAFCLLVAAALVVELLHHRRHDPLTSRELADMKAALVKTPLDDSLKQRIRALDLRLRIAHDRHLTLLRRGQWLLLGGMAVFLASLQATVWRKKIARPGKVQKPPGWQARQIAVSGAAVALLGAAVGLGAWMLAARSRTLLAPHLARAGSGTDLPVSVAPAAPAATPRPGPPFPTPEEVARNWGRFRGPRGDGVSAFTNMPLAWNLETGEGILWKTPAPSPDPNSPVVWDKRLFLTAATARKREVFCYDTETGTLLWQKPAENVPGGGAVVELSEASGGFAAATAAVDGRRVYAFFANGDMVAFRLDGTLAWARSFAPIENPYGHAASLALWQDRLILQLDHGDSDKPMSRLIALNTADGKTVWETRRQTHGTWSSPLVIEAAGQPQIIALGNPHAIAYAAGDGRELWRVEGIDGEVTPSPIFAGGLVLAPSPSTKLIAIRPDGTGDVTKTHVAWTAEDGVPDITSPLAHGPWLFTVTTAGTLTCAELQTGKRVWEKDLDMDFNASPTLVGERLYLVSLKGVSVVAAAAGEYRELGRGHLGEPVHASPAFVGGRVFARGTKHLFCLGEKQ